MINSPVAVGIHGVHQVHFVEFLFAVVVEVEIAVVGYKEVEQVDEI